MKFTLVKDLRQDPLMRPVLSGLLVFLILFFISNLAQKYEQIGLHVNTATLVMYGDEENFIDPISITSLLEMLHGDLFMMMMTLLSLSAVYIRLSPHINMSKVVIHLLMISAICSILFLLAAYYYHTIFLALWIFCLWIWHLLALSMSIESLYRLYNS